MQKPELDARCEKLQLALGKLASKLRLIETSPAYKSVWTLHDVHGGRYDGPTWQAELREAEELLAWLTSA